MSKSRDLKKELARDLRQRQRSELSELIGRKTPYKKVKRSRGKKKSVEDGQGVLVPYINRRMRIRATYKGELIKASVRKNGWVNYDGYLYRSPHA